jgi:hypothetical protein
VAAFSLTLISIISFRKAKEDIVFLWLGLLFFSPVVSFVSNLFVYLKQGNASLFHASLLFNLSWGGYLTLAINNLGNRQKRFFNRWLFLPSAAYLPFMFYSFINPQYVQEIVSNQLRGNSFLISCFYNFLLVAYSLSANILLLTREIRKVKFMSRYSIRREILTVILVLQLLAFVPFILNLDILYVILYMPVFGQILFLYIFFRLSPEEATRFFNPVKKDKYSGLTISEKRKDELKNKILDFMDKKKPFLREDCSLQLIAGEFNELPHTVSMIINSHFNRSFPDFINCYRVKRAIEILQSGNINLTIEGVASDQAGIFFGENGIACNVGIA